MHHPPLLFSFSRLPPTTLTSMHKTHRTLWEKSKEDFKSQRMSEFSLRQCFLVTSEATPTKYHHHDCLNLS